MDEVMEDTIENEMTGESMVLFSEHYENTLKIARKHARHMGVDSDFAENIAIERLMKCVKRGDNEAETNVPFSGYVEKSVRLDILNAKLKRQRPLGELVEQSPMPESYVTVESIPSLSLIFDFKHRQVYESRRMGTPYSKIARIYGVSKKRMQSVIEKKGNHLKSILKFMKGE